jgi:cap2 methyltransferase
MSFLISPPAGEQPLGGSTPPQTAENAEIEKTIGVAKSQLDQFNHDKRLAEAFRLVDIYSDLKATIRRHYGGQVVTNAWLKIYEIVGMMGLGLTARSPIAAPHHTYVLRAFCNAELPGAFICSLSQYICTTYPNTRFEWVGSSLYPDPENTAGREGSGGGGEILGDYYGLYARNPDRWLMSPEMRGDVTKVEDIRALVAGAKARLGQVDLYTSDAGIGVSDDYLRQEETTAPIHLGQTVVGLMSLRKGGVMVVKTYTFVHPSSISLMAVCASVFDSFYVTKPVTSRPANSEVYIVGIGFHGLTPEHEEHLLAAVEKFDFSRTLTVLGTPETEHTEQALLAAGTEIHKKQQVAFLEEALAFYKSYRHGMQDLRAHLRPAARKAQSEWIKQNNPIRLPTSCHIPGNDW